MPQDFTRQDITFTADNTPLGGWLYRPTGPGPHPALVMSHGFSCVKELYLDRFAACFAQAGFMVLLYDHRNFGSSGGQPRGEIDPARQLSDMRDAVTWITMQPGVDARRIGLWGSSYSGGHVLLLAAQDARIGCVVAQVPTISGSQTFARRVAPGAVPALRRDFARDRAQRMAGQAPAMRAVIPEGVAPGIYGGADAVAFWQSAARLAPAWRNAVTLRSLELAAAYEPALTIARISPKPLLMIVARDDDVTPADLALEAYQRALEPKRLCLIPGGHFDPYTTRFDVASREALAWFRAHLAG